MRSITSTESILEKPSTISPKAWNLLWFFTRFWLLFVAIPAVANPVESGNHWFVCPTRGEDSHTGVFEEKPLKTLAKAVQLVRPGDVIVLLPGYHEGGVTIPAGRPEAPITVTASEPGRVFVGKPKLVNRFTPVEGLPYVFQATIETVPAIITELNTKKILRQLASKEDVSEIAGSYTYDPSKQTLFIHPSDGAPATAHTYLVSIPSTGFQVSSHNRIEGITFSGFGEAAIHGKEVKDLQIRHCRAYANGYGIFIQGGDDCLIQGNHLWRNVPAYPEGSQIHITAPYAKQIIIEGNLVHDSPRYGIRFYSSGPTNDCQFKGNIVWNNATGGMYFKGGDGINQAGTRNVSTFNGVDDFRAADGGHNTYGRIAAGWDGYEKNTDLVIGGKKSALAHWNFADTSYQDFRLQADSPARGKAPDGSDLGAYPFDGSVLYVGPSGSNGNTGQSLAQAWKTPSHAIKQLKPGQTLYLIAHEWREPLHLEGVHGTAAEPIVIRAYGKEPSSFSSAQIHNCSHLQLENIMVDGASARVEITASQHIALKNWIVAGKIGSAPSSPIEDNLLTHLIQQVRDFFGRAKTLSPSAIFVSDSNRITIESSAVINSTGNGITVRNSENTWLISNLFFNTRQAAIAIEGKRGSLWSDYNGYVANEDAAPVFKGNDQSIPLVDWQIQFAADPHSILIAKTDFPNWQNGDYRAIPSSALQTAGRFAAPIGPFSALSAETARAIDGIEIVSTTSSSANVTFYTPGKITGVMAQWGLTPAYGMEYSRSGPASGERETYHTISFLGLEPGKTYHARVGFQNYEVTDGVDQDAVVWSEDFTFTTSTEDTAPRNLYISLQGDDKNDGLSQQSAWRTLRHAARHARAGDTVTIAPGRYHEPLRPLQTGISPERRITFRAERPLTVFLDGGSIQKSGGRSHCVQLMNKAFIRLENLAFQNVNVWDNGGYRGGFGYSSLVFLSGAPGTEIKNCLFDGRGNYTIGIMTVAADTFPGVPPNIPELVASDNVFYRNWWATAIYSNRKTLFTNNAFIRSLIFMLGGQGPEKSFVLRNNIYQSLIPTKNRNRLFSNPAQLDSDYNCFVWDNDNTLRHVAYIDREARVFAQGLSGWQKHFQQDRHSIEANPGYPLSELAGFGSVKPKDPNRRIMISDLILPENSPCLNRGENMESMGPRWNQFLNNE